MRSAWMSLTNLPTSRILYYPTKIEFQFFCMGQLGAGGKFILAQTTYYEHLVDREQATRSLLGAVMRET